MKAHQIILLRNKSMLYSQLLEYMSSLRSCQRHQDKIRHSVDYLIVREIRGQKVGWKVSTIVNHICSIAASLPNGNVSRHVCVFVSLIFTRCVKFINSNTVHRDIFRSNDPYITNRNSFTDISA